MLRRAALCLTFLAMPAHAQDAVPVETATLGDAQITLHLHPFLNSEELDLLRVVMTSKEALALFVLGTKGHAAMAASPDEGFIRDGVPPASAIALADFADAETARTDVLTACDAARKGAAPCVVILEIAPK
jgi:hypothetical protein